MANFNPSQIQKYLKGVDYPTDKKTLVDTARSEGAEDDVVNALQNIPDQQYHSPADLMKAFSSGGGDNDNDSDDNE